MRILQGVSLPDLQDLMSRNHLQVIGRFHSDVNASKDDLMRGYQDSLTSYVNDDKTIKLALEDDGNVKGCIIMSESQWDTNHFGFKIGKYRFNLFDSDVGLSNRLCLVSKLKEMADSNQFVLLFIRVPLSDISSVQAIEHAGGLFTDNLVTFYRRTDGRISQNFSNLGEIEFGNVEDGDEVVLQQISEKIFTIDHFHNDSKLSNIDSTKLYSKWVSNCIHGLSDAIIVARINRKIVGFITCKVEKIGSYKFGTIDLIGVSKEYWGRQIGSSLVSESLKWFNERVNAVFVGTQGGNSAAMGLYQKCGFKFVSSEATLHLWLRDS